MHERHRPSRSWLSLSWIICFLGALQPAFAATPPTVVVRLAMCETLKSGPIPIEIGVTNNGPVPAEHLVVTCVLSPGTTVVETKPTAELTTNQLRWPLDGLAPGEQRVFWATVTPATDPPAPEVRCVATVTYQQSVTETRVTTIVRPALTLKICGPDTGSIGKLASYAVTVTNRGQNPVEGITLFTSLPSGLSHPRGNDLKNVIGTLQPGEAKVFPLKLTPTVPGELAARVRVEAEGTAPVTQPLTLRVREMGLVLRVKGPAKLSPDWSGTYQFSVVNPSNDSVEHVTLEASLPEGIAFVATDNQGSYDAETHRVRWQLPEVPAGGTRSVKLHGSARAVGAQPGTLSVSAPNKPCQHLNWTTMVTVAPPALAQ